MITVTTLGFSQNIPHTKLQGLTDLKIQLFYFKPTMAISQLTEQIGRDYSEAVVDILIIKKTQPFKHDRERRRWGTVVTYTLAKETE